MSDKVLNAKDIGDKNLKTLLDMVAQRAVYLSQQQGYENAGSHNGIYRGLYLGDEVTDEQWEAIKDGTFFNLYIGDYWTIGDVNWRIAHFNYWLNTGDTSCTDNHVVIVPETALYNAVMNGSNTTSGGYVGSAMYKSNLASAKTTISNAFGSAHILNHRELLTISVNGNVPNNWAWYDSTVEIMDERMVYGGDAWSQSNGYDAGIDWAQLALFQLDRSAACIGASWWLRDVAASTFFATVYETGRASSSDASGSFGVRPAFGIYNP